jgi:hypothetical protein
MFTVKELIEALKQCPEDYEVLMRSNPYNFAIGQVARIEIVGIDHDEGTVDLFAE